MPCYEVRTVSMAFEAADAEVLADVLLELGLCGPHGRKLDALSQAETIIRNAMMVVLASEADLVNKVKRTYARHVIDKAARRMRWQVKTTGVNMVEVRRGA